MSHKMKIDRIPDPPWFEVLSWSWGHLQRLKARPGRESPEDGGRGGGSGGGGELNIVIAANQPVAVFLQQFAATGGSLGSATLISEAIDPETKANVEFLRVILKDVIVATFSTGNDTDMATLNFGKASTSYNRPQPHTSLQEDYHSLIARLKFLSRQHLQPPARGPIGTP